MNSKARRRRDVIRVEMLAMSVAGIPSWQAALVARRYPSVDRLARADPMRIPAPVGTVPARALVAAARAATGVPDEAPAAESDASPPRTEPAAASSIVDAAGSVPSRPTDTVVGVPLGHPAWPYELDLDFVGVDVPGPDKVRLNP